MAALSRCSCALDRIGRALEIVASRAPTAAERGVLKARAAALDAALAPAGADEAARAVAALFALVPSGRAEGEETREVVKLYAGFVGREPAFAIAAACRASIEAGERFRPAAGELVVRARRAAAPWRAERQRIADLLAAKVVAQPGAEERARVVAAFRERLIPALEAVPGWAGDKSFGGKSASC